jgi:hypothetical protein
MPTYDKLTKELQSLQKAISQGHVSSTKWHRPSDGYKLGHIPFSSDSGPALLECYDWP